jgi:hypothetical protein
MGGIPLREYFLEFQRFETVNRNSLVLSAFGAGISFESREVFGFAFVLLPMAMAIGLARKFRTGRTPERRILGRLAGSLFLCPTELW